MNYMVTADIATLDYAAKFKSELLYNRYQAARNTIQQFQDERARTRTSFRRSSTIPWRRSSCFGAWRSWAFASSSSTAT